MFLRVRKMKNWFLPFKSNMMSYYHITFTPNKEMLYDNDVSQIKGKHLIQHDHLN